MEENGQSGTPNGTPGAPRGVFRVTVDEKGRLKLPAAVNDYWQGLGEKKLFITTLDVKEVRIYPLPVWAATEALLEEPGDNFEYRQDLAMIASGYGREEDLDGQGRLTLPSNLRKELGLEKDEVCLRFYQGHLKLVSAAEHERRLAEARANVGDKLKALRL